MLRIKTIWFTICLALVVTTGCQDELSERYQSSDSGATPSIGEFFTSMLNNDRVRPSYWNISTFVNWHIGVYSQSVAFLTSQSMYQQNEAYTQERWDDFYRPGANGSGVVAVFREIEKAYNNLPQSKKADAELFLNAARIVLYDQTAQMVDLWGDVPFNDAGGLNANGKIIYPEFDKAEEIYTSIIADLNVVSEYFAKAQWTTTALSSFGKQDILLSGSTAKWRQYCNSLRLRLLMRVSFSNEQFARERVIEMLNDPASYPMLDATDYVAGVNDVLLHPVTTYIHDLHEAFTDWTNFPAPYYALEQVLKPANDLRIPVLYDRYGSEKTGSFVPNAGYNAMPLTSTQNEQKENIEEYAILDSVTFLFNSKLPGVVMTSSEVSFLKAEAHERWGGGDASTEYLNGIRNSIKFYFYLNSLNTIGSSSQHLDLPANSEIESFLASEPVAYTGTVGEKLEKIWTQKWLHSGFLQAGECWSELRRTGYPAVVFHPALLTGYELPPNRLTYPENEKMYNENYAKVSSLDLRETKIFWQVK
jgi:hypothetical protein